VLVEKDMIYSTNMEGCTSARMDGNVRKNMFSKIHLVIISARLLGMVKRRFRVMKMKRYVCDASGLLIRKNSVGKPMAIRNINSHLDNA